MEMSQGNECIVSLNKQIYHLFLQKWRTGEQSRSWLWCWYQWEGEDVEGGHRRVSVVQIRCTHVCKWKNDTC
jgi:hypothetical protein